MLCEICGENEATFHYSEVVNGNKTEPVSYTHLTLPTKLEV